MSAKVMQMPEVHQGYSMARYVLRNHPYHDLDAIDSAFEVLVYSQDPFDKALCRVIEDEMWLVPSPGVMTIAVTMAAVLATCVGLAMVIGSMVL